MSCSSVGFSRRSPASCSIANRSKGLFALSDQSRSRGRPQIVRGGIVGITGRAGIAGEVEPHPAQWSP